MKTGNHAPIQRLFPFLKWFEGYDLNRLRADAVAGVTVALVLIPQSMAYAQLANLPPYYGLYAAFLPPLVAAMFGSSFQLATGPVAVVSLMTSTALAPLATAGSESYIAYAILLALMVGAFQFLLGTLRLGLVLNFLSHPVVNGFTNAAAIIIATSQLSKLFGVDVDNAEHHYETIYNVAKAAFHYTHLPTLGMAVLAFTVMITLKKVNPRIPNVLFAVALTTVISATTGFEKNVKADVSQIDAADVRDAIHLYNTCLERIDETMTQRVETYARLKDTLQVYGKHSVQVLRLESQVGMLDLETAEYKERVFQLRAELRRHHFVALQSPAESTVYVLEGDGGVEAAKDANHWRLKVANKPLVTNNLKLVGGGAVVGNIPRGLPDLMAPKLNLSVISDLLLMTVIISLIGFMEAISIAKAMATKTGQRIDPNRELVGQGLANMVGAFSQAYPASGSFSRSAVNLQAGAVTGLSSGFSSLVVGVTLLFFTPLLYQLPQSVLAAVIMMAVVSLLNVKGFIHAYRAQRYDGIISVITFLGTLGFAPHLDRGILIGVTLSIGHYLFRTIRPDIAVLSYYMDGTFRNADRRKLKKCKHIALIRFNNSLFFSNVSYLDEKVFELIAAMPELRHVHIVGNAINELDASGEETLSLIVSQVRERGLSISFSGLNDAVMDVMARTRLLEKIGPDNIYGNVNLCVHDVYRRTHRETTEHPCPLMTVVPVEMEVEPGIVEKLAATSPWAKEFEAHKKLHQREKGR